MAYCLQFFRLCTSLYTALKNRLSLSSFSKLFSVGAYFEGFFTRKNPSLYLRAICVIIEYVLTCNFSSCTFLYTALKNRLALSSFSELLGSSAI